MRAEVGKNLRLTSGLLNSHKLAICVLQIGEIHVKNFYTAWLSIQTKFREQGMPGKFTTVNLIGAKLT